MHTHAQLHGCMSGHIPAVDVARELLTTSRYWEKSTTACTGPLVATAPTTISGCFIRNHADSAPACIPTYIGRVEEGVQYVVGLLSFAYTMQYSSHLSDCKCPRSSLHLSMLDSYGFKLIDHTYLHASSQ